MAIHSGGSVYGHDFAALLQTIADLPDAGLGRNRSPLPVLIFLWMLGERDRPSGRRAAGSEALGGGRCHGGDGEGAAHRSGRQDRLDELRAQAPREAEFRGDAIGRGCSAPISRAPDQIDDAVSLLRDVAGVGSQRQWKTQRRFKRVLAKILPATRFEPIATVVVPVLSIPSAPRRPLGRVWLRRSPTGSKFW